jgi:hypothetical protein
VALAGWAGYRASRYFAARADLRAARQALDRRQWSEVRTDLAACLRAWADSPKAHLLAARAARRLQLLGEAAEHLDACDRLRGDTQATHVERALLRVQRGDLASVETFLRYAVARDGPDAAESFDVLDAALKQRPLLLRNERRPGDQPHEVRFADVSAKAGPYFQSPYLGRGAALVVLDNDGRVDLILTPTNEPAVILRNRRESGHHWLGVALVGRPYRDAIGARLKLEVGGDKPVRAVKGGGSYLSSGDRRVVFGLGPRERVGRLTVRWPSGRTQIWEGLAVDRYWVLTEGEEQARPFRDSGRGR